MDKSLILNQIKKYYGFKRDSDFAIHLGISAQMLSNWKARNTYDAELLYTKCLDISPEYLLTGNVPMLKSNVIPISSEVDFTYKELAEARLDVIEGLRFRIDTLEQKIIAKDEKINELRYAQEQSFLYPNVAEPAPELIAKKRK